MYLSSFCSAKCNDPVRCLVVIVMAGAAVPLAEDTGAALGKGHRPSLKASALIYWQLRPKSVTSNWRPPLSPPAGPPRVPRGPRISPNLWQPALCTLSMHFSLGHSVEPAHGVAGPSDLEALVSLLLHPHLHMFSPFWGPAQ